MATKISTNPENDLGIDSTPAKDPQGPGEKLSLQDYLAREPRLANRPEMRGAFERACAREGLSRAFVSTFAARLDQLERGTR